MFKIIFIIYILIMPKKVNSTKSKVEANTTTNEANTTVNGTSTTVVGSTVPLADPVTQNNTEYNKLLKEWVNIEEEIKKLTDMVEPLESKRDAVVKKLRDLMHKTTSEEETVVKKPVTKGKTKQVVTEAETVKSVKPDLVKPDLVKPDLVKPDLVKPDLVKPEQAKKVVTKAPAKTTKASAKEKLTEVEAEPETKPVKKVTKSEVPPKKVTKPTNSKQKIEVDSEESEIKLPKVVLESDSSESDMESLSACSSESDCSGGEED